MKRWQLQQAKTHLSELIENAQSLGPQLITRHGADRAVVLSVEEFHKLKPQSPLDQAPSFTDWLLNGPILEEDDEFFEIMDNIRDRQDHGRPADSGFLTDEEHG